MGKKNDRTPKITATKSLKKIVALKHFIEAGSTGLFELEALSLYGDTCLHTTASDLKRTHEMEFEKRPHWHTRNNGQRVKFTRYILTSEDKALALVRLYGGAFNDY
jgi:hypothetical protein